MSRALKFRAWVETRTFNGEPKGFEYLDLYADNENDFANFPPKNIEQYTGLKDKNGKEIYEGDIVYDIYTGDEVFIVGWDKDKASFMLADTADYPMAYFDEYKLDKDLEIIGNIHENPELIGGEE